MQFVGFILFKIQHHVQHITTASYVADTSGYKNGHTTSLPLRTLGWWGAKCYNTGCHGRNTVGQRQETLLTAALRPFWGQEVQSSERA